MSRLAHVLANHCLVSLSRDTEFDMYAYTSNPVTGVRRCTKTHNGELERLSHQPRNGYMVDTNINTSRLYSGPLSNGICRMMSFR